VLRSPVRFLPQRSIALGLSNRSDMGKTSKELEATKRLMGARYAP
jgi:hypothetical protein